MAAVSFPRSILPAISTMPIRAGGVLISQAQSGIINMRQVSVPGWRWEESFNFKLDEGGHYLMAQAAYLWNWPDDVVKIKHQKQLTVLGAGGGTPLVKGGSQSGWDLDTDGWPNSTAVLKGGDIIQFASQTRVHRVRQTITSDGSGNATIYFTSPIAVADSPADNAAVAVTGDFNYYVRIAAPPVVPDMDAADFVAGYRLVFQEVL